MDAIDKHACAELIQAWGLYRDQGKWPELLATFVPEGQIAVSWFSGSFHHFVDRCRQSFDAGQRSKHQIFPSLVRVEGDRALAETNIVILVRQRIADVLADMTSYARFLDRLERRGGRWAILERAAIYERDRLDPVTHHRLSTSCSRRPTSRSIRKHIVTWRRVSSPPAAAWRRWSMATARRRRRSCMRVTRHGSAAPRLAASARAKAWLGGGGV